VSNGIRLADLADAVQMQGYRQTIAASDVLYGVTMQEKGISNTVSMKFNEAAEHTDWVKPATVGEGK
jgi:hypothetical protein